MGAFDKPDFTVAPGPHHIGGGAKAEGWKTNICHPRQTEPSLKAGRRVIPWPFPRGTRRRRTTFLQLEFSLHAPRAAFGPRALDSDDDGDLPGGGADGGGSGIKARERIAALAQSQTRALIKAMSSRRRAASCTRHARSTTTRCAAAGARETHSAHSRF